MSSKIPSPSHRDKTGRNGDETRFDMEMPQHHSIDVPTLKKSMLDRVDLQMRRFTDPEVIASMESAIVDAAEVRKKLESLPKLPNHETIDTAKSKLIEIESLLLKQLWEKIWEIVLSPCPSEMDGNEWRAHIEKECVHIEKECKDTAKKDRQKYSEMIILFETYASHEKMLYEAETKLLALSYGDYRVEEIDESVVDTCEESTLTRRIGLSNRRLRKGLPNPEELESLLHSSSLKVKKDSLNIVSSLATMNKAFYDYLEKANILETLKYFLSNENEDLVILYRSCKVVANLCYQSSYFFNALKEYGIIRLIVDLSAHSHQTIRQVSCWTMARAATNSDLLYDELRRCIPQLTKLLQTEGEEDKTKMYVASVLKYLVKNSNKLAEDMVSKGALKALIYLVADRSRLISNEMKNDYWESVIEITIEALHIMCAHAPCRKLISSSEMFLALKKLIESPNLLIANSTFVRSLKVTLK